MPMRPEDIPRQKERLILADATQKFEKRSCRLPASSPRTT